MVCSDALHLSIIHYFAIATVATLVLFVFSLEGVDTELAKYMAPGAVLTFKLIMTFGIVYIADRYIENWRAINVVC